MKLRIEKEFTDKYTNKKYKVGEEVEFADERGNELLSDSRALVKEVKETSKATAKEVAEGPTKAVPKKPTKKSKK